MARDAGSGAAVRSAETRGRAPEGRGGASHELPPDERLSIMSIGTARQSSTIRATERRTKCGFAEFVDNVDTRARIQIHLLLSLLDHLPPGRLASVLGRHLPSTISTNWSAKPGLLGMGRFNRFGCVLIVEERYVCLTAESLAGLVIATKLCFFSPPPSERISDLRLARGTFTKPDFKNRAIYNYDNDREQTNFAFFAPRPPNGFGSPASAGIAQQNFAFFCPPPSERISDLPASGGYFHKT